MSESTVVLTVTNPALWVHPELGRFTLAGHDCDLGASAERPLRMEHRKWCAGWASPLPKPKEGA